MLRLIAPLVAPAFALTSAGPVAQAKAPAAKPDKPAAMKTEPVDINDASEDQLKAIRGIGDAYAKKIVEGGPDKWKDELVQKKVVPTATYVKIPGQIVASQRSFRSRGSSSTIGISSFATTHRDREGERRAHS
jgi:DNA uptake protein ComE-like DNA-binding protein